MINGRTRIHVVANGTMMGQRYIDEVLLPHVLLFRGAVGDKFVFMDDNATCHRTFAVQDCLDSEDALGRQVAGRNYPPTNKNTLIRALTEEWDKLPQQLLDNVVQSMSRTIFMNSVASTLNRVTDMEFNNQISVLTQHNWNTWRHDMQVLLMHYGCWQFIIQTKPEQPDEEATYKEKLDLQLRKDRCYTLIYTNISSDLKNLITETTDGVAAWKILKDHFEPVTRARSTVQQIYRWKEEDFRVVKIEAELILEANRLQLMKQDLEKAENAYLSSFTSKKSKTLPGATAAAHGNPNGKNDYQKKSEIWHQRFCHVNNDYLVKTSKTDSVKGLPRLTDNGKTHCIPCKLAKSKRVSFKKDGAVRSKRPLELLHMDLCGPMPTESQGGNKYFLSIIDDYSRKVTVFPIRNKSDVFHTFIRFQKRAERFLSRKVIAVRTDGGLEFCNKDMDNSLTELGIKHEVTNSYTPEMNGVAERFNLTALDGIKTLLKSSEVPISFGEKHYFVSLMRGIEFVTKTVTKRLSKNIQGFSDLSEQQALMVEVTIPNCYKQAIRSRDASKWHDAMDKEINVMMERKVWDLVDHPDNIKILENRWVYTIKYDENNKIVRYKARLVARGNTQLRGESFDEVFQEYKLELSKVKSLKLRCYSDSDFATNRDDRVSMGGFITFIDETPISSRTFKQKSVSLSTMEAEYVSLTEAAKEFIWLKNVIDNKSLNLELSENVMFCDIQAAISFSKSPVENCRTKHIDVRYHFLRNLIYDKDRMVVYSASTPEVWGSINGLRKLDSAFHPRYIGSINEYQACFGS
ncbi:retrovirus-related Pol polyprotein from transposon TNT 1-94 [Trichonephila clavipes]|nr:retrovirus-related Pol polyprotein from transposon TNT 1-94 [Trichonephila clavipes]